MRTKLNPCGNSGHRVSVYIRVNKIDFTKFGGYSFIGEFLPINTEIELANGTVFVQKKPEGSVKNGYHSAHVFKIENDEIIDHTDQSYNWQTDFLSFRDRVQKIFRSRNAFIESLNHKQFASIGQAINPLAQYSIDELQTEINRRAQK